MKKLVFVLFFYNWYLREKFQPRSHFIRRWYLGECGPEWDCC